MNLRQQSSKYGAAVLFTAAIAGVFLIAASIRAGFRPDLEIWLAAALVVSLILHARAGFALSRAEQEIELLRGLVHRFDAAAPKAPVRLTPKSSGEANKRPDGVLGEVRSAIENARVDLYLQPVVKLPQRERAFFEAYSRLRRADGSILGPADYLEAAESAGRIGLIDNMILLRAVQALRQLELSGTAHSLFCNISPASIFDEDFFARFTDFLDANEDLAQRLVFEFTYPAVEIMHTRVRRNLDAVAERGVCFSVDHVRSFDLDAPGLRDRNFRFIKIPGSLILAECAKGDVGRARLTALKDRLAENGIDLVAEKIEQDAQLAEITALGFGYAQGLLFGAPCPAHKIIAAASDRAA